MLMIITLLNDGTLIAVGYDRVVPSRMPNRWNLKILFIVSSALAAVAGLSSLLFLWACLESWNPGTLLYELGLGELSYGQITTGVYLKVSISDFLTLFSARTQDNFFWSHAPSPVLLAAASVAFVLSTVIACSYPDTYPDGQHALGLLRRQPYGLFAVIWFYCLICFVIQDIFKVLLYAYLEKFNIFRINEVGGLDDEEGEEGLLLGKDLGSRQHSRSDFPPKRHEKRVVRAKREQKGENPMLKQLLP